MIAGLLLAAGAGQRFGGRKLLAELDGRPLLEHAVAAMAAAPVDSLFVVLGADAAEVLRRVDLHGAEPVFCDRWALGQSASLRAGIDALDPDADAAVVALGDQPLLSPRAVARVIACRADEFDAIRATYGGAPGHPVMLERSLFPALRELQGDAGARDLLAGARVREIPCDGLGDPADVDTPEQLATLAARRPSAPSPRSAEPIP